MRAPFPVVSRDREGALCVADAPREWASRFHGPYRSAVQLGEWRGKVAHSPDTGSFFCECPVASTLIVGGEGGNGVMVARQAGGVLVGARVLLTRRAQHRTSHNAAYAAYYGRDASIRTILIDGASHRAENRVLEAAPKDR